jgi:hypothetical protein
MALPRRRRGGTPTGTSSGDIRGGNDTFPATQRQAAKGATTATCCRLPSHAIARLLPRLQMLARSGRGQRLSE